jgi:Arc-like DNA binding domain
MPAITLKGLPVPLHRQLKDSAERSRRSLNAEILYRLEASFAAPAQPSVQEKIARLRRLHASLGMAPLSADFVDAAIAEGRE